MKRFPWVVLLLTPAVLFAQNAPSNPISKGSYELGVFAAAGNGLGATSGTQFANFGVRVGRVLTPDKGSGWKRGNLEHVVTFMPVYYVFHDPAVPYPRAVYGMSIEPINLKWNFTSGRKIVPWAEIGAGLVWTTRPTPPGATTRFNYTPFGAFGLQFFTRERQAWTLALRGVHLSNSSFAQPNPGYNATVHVSVGYSWFK